MADLSAVPPGTALTAMLAAMAAIIIFALAAWIFGFPTSESHALIAALSGAAVAAGGAGATSAAAWGKVLLGLALSSLGGVLCGYILSRSALNSPVIPRPRGPRTARAIQALCAVLLSCLHGAQDGLKFVGVLALGDGILTGGFLPPGEVNVAGCGAQVVLCALVMGLGTLFGGKRIIEAVGQRMVELDTKTGALSDLTASGLLLAATAFGLPVSTTHTKTCAVMGAGAGAGKPMNSRTMGGIVFTWVVTFPACAALGYLLARLGSWLAL